MLCIVPDTNILISAFIVEGNEYRLIEKCFKREILLITPVDIIGEFEEVALRPKFGFTEEEIDEFVNAIIKASAVVMPRVKVTGVCRDPDDEKVIEAAVEGRASFIVSGDKDMLILEKIRGIRIVSAGELLRLAESLRNI
ncbi:MAG TPA: putative toxin-antitoxin system toxin component, PIN family [Candidatus Nanoarchaeia archaeon]|nr:putative toxin-antitoxin system toxin component, PIN family [Candidatus Nanoarchaeia archaeon]